MSAYSLPGAAGTEPVRDRVRALFHVTATAEPGTLPRLVEPFAKMGLVPTRLHASREDGDGSWQSIDMRIVGVSRHEAELVEAMLRRVVGVRQLIVVTEDA
ncbi:MAG: hypothetical protein GC150_03520 [Rhizobiales bacterium]|nr:hypothetical protein [Hyphomicrobiales bacterium]